eukprot:GFKZ01014295.1.p1 GENE.GFKZ01014295.1~~GFKZ01014295.1.p1  ORF type:complete len:435 (-),score=74.04 GFKZ01014295.1:833-2137(-)
MPPSLRELYFSGTWRSHPVYLWPSVLELSRSGHRLSAQAEAALATQSYKPSTLADGKTIANAAIADAVAVHAQIGDRVANVIAAQRAARSSHEKTQSRVYMQKRRLWVEKLDETENAKTAEQREKERDADRELLRFVRSRMNMSDREADLTFTEFEAAGGTAGGLERWGRSITTIPDQNFNVLDPPADGGGVLIENPLRDHYMARNINPWTRAERLLFLEKYSVMGKNFRKIAAFFEHKSVDDCVRFYYDNKIRLGLKQLLKDAHFRKRGAKKLALVELSKLPVESRSIKDNFIHQPGFSTPEESNDQHKEYESKSNKPSITNLGRNWTREDRQALVFALCRYDVTGDEEDKPVTTVWASIAAAVGNKTPRQCRQFYFQNKVTLGLGSYSPPRPAPYVSAKWTDSSDAVLGIEEPARKRPRRSSSIAINLNQSA